MMKVNISIYSTKHIRNFKCQVANSTEAISFVKYILENILFFDKKTWTISIYTTDDDYKTLYNFRDQVESICKSLTHITYEYDLVTMDRNELEITIKNIKYKGE